MSTEDHDGIEVKGNLIEVWAQAFRQYPTVIEKYLSRFGVTRDGTTPESLSETWVPLETWLRVGRAIAQEVGPTTVYSMGKRVGEFAPLPPRSTGSSRR